MLCRGLSFIKAGRSDMTKGGKGRGGERLVEERISKIMQRPKQGRKTEI